MFETKIIDQKAISQAVELLKKGEVVAFPTETVYGLGADIFNERTIQKIYQVKGRPSDNPLIAHVATMEQLKQIVAEVPPKALQLMKKFWPGPLTIVLKKKETISKEATAGLDTIGVRMPSHPLALELIRQFGSPLVAPSANLSGRPSPTTAQHVYDDLHGKISLILDGGPCEIGIESTVVDLSTDAPQILRPGFVTQEQLEKTLHQPVLSAQKDSPIKAPGMKYRHYAPKIPVKIISDWGELDSEAPNQILLISNQSPPEKFHTTHQPLNSQTLFAAFRDAEKNSIQKIVVFVSNEDQKNVGLMNRLHKAASKN